MAGAHLSDLTRGVSLKVESAQGTATAIGDINVMYDFGEADVQHTIVAEDEKACGNELFTGQTITANDAQLPIDTSLKPSSGGWFIHGVTGGGTGYGVTGAGPYVHTFKKIPAGSYFQKSRTVVSYDAGSGVYHLFKGGVIPSITITGSLTQKQIRITGSMQFDGSRTDTTAPTLTCSPESAFRFTAATINIKPHGGANISGLKKRGFVINYTNNGETSDEAERTDLFIASQERGDREATVDYSVLLDPGETLDDYLFSNQQVAWDISVPHATSGHIWTAVMPKGTIKSINYTRETRARKRVGTIRIRGDVDVTSPTTEGQSPMYFTMTNGVATYEAS